MDNPKLVIANLRHEILIARQAMVSLDNIAKQYHKLMFIALYELYKVDPNNRIFFNGSVSDTLMDNIKKASDIAVNRLPKESTTDFHGDNGPGLPAKEAVRAALGKNDENVKQD